LLLGEKHSIEAGFSEQINWYHLTDDQVPIPDGSADLVFVKNVLGYVPSIDAMLAEFRRVLKPGGIVRMSDSDWDIFAVEPLGPERLGELIQYASHAFKDPHVGRHLYGSARRAGYAEVNVTLLPVVDTEGFLVNLILKQLVKYALDGGYPPEKGEKFLADAYQASKNKELLIVVPQFMVTAVAP
jgi:SAM-dependent methyltransferase